MGGSRGPRPTVVVTRRRFQSGNPAPLWTVTSTGSSGDTKVSGEFASKYPEWKLSRSVWGGGSLVVEGWSKFGINKG